MYQLAYNECCAPTRTTFSFATGGALGESKYSENPMAISSDGRLFTWGTNYYGEAGQGNPKWLGSGSNYDAVELTEIIRPTQLGTATNWKKMGSGEFCSMAMNTDGELYGWGQAYYDCCVFGLPIDSGEGRREWDGVMPGVGDAYYFFTPTRCAPGFTFKDFSFSGYHTLAIGQDDYLYYWGVDFDDCFGAGNPDGTKVHTPTKHATFTSKVKLVSAGESGISAVVTTDDKVYLCGYAYNTPGLYHTTFTEITGITIPAGETIVEIVASTVLVMVRLSDGTVWIVGDRYYNLEASDTSTFVQLTLPAGKTFKQVASLVDFCYVLDSSGNAYGWGYVKYGDFYENPCAYNATWIDTPTLVFAANEGQILWDNIVYHGYNASYVGVDTNGNLYTWGWNLRSALGIGVSDTQAVTDILAPGEVAIDDVCTPQRPEIPVDSTGTAITSGYIIYPCPGDNQGPPLEYNPYVFRYWYRGYTERGGFPCNCYVVSLGVSEDRALMVFSGRKPNFQWEPSNPLDSLGYDLVFATYSFSTNTWEMIYHDELWLPSVPAGEAAADGSLNAFYDQSARIINIPLCLCAEELTLSDLTDIGMHVWVVTSVYSVNHTFFPNSYREPGRNKMDVHTSGKVAVGYRDDSTMDLNIETSANSGGSFSLVRTISNPSDYALTYSDIDGYLYLAYVSGGSDVVIEETQDNGVSWSTLDTLSTGNPISTIKIQEDHGVFFIFVSTTVDTFVYWTDDFVTYQSDSTSNTADAVSMGLAVDVDNVDKVAVTNTGAIYDDEGAWYESTIQVINTTRADGGLVFDFTSRAEITSDSKNDRFAITANSLRTLPDQRHSFLLSIDGGVTFNLVRSPLEYFEFYDSFWKPAWDLGNKKVSMSAYSEPGLRTAFMGTIAAPSGVAWVRDGDSTKLPPIPYTRR